MNETFTCSHCGRLVNINHLHYLDDEDDCDGYWQMALHYTRPHGS